MAAPTSSLASVASQYKIPLNLAQALIHQESGGNPGAVSSAGAVGLTQVMPATAAGMYGITPEQAAIRLKDPTFATEAGLRYLSEQKQTFGSWKLALAAYNAGPQAVKDYHGVPPYQETQNYVRDILGRTGPLVNQPQAPLPQGPPAQPSVVSQPPETPSVPSTSSALASLMAISQGKHPNPLAELTALANNPPPPVGKVAPPGPRDSPLPKIQVQGHQTPKTIQAIEMVKQYLGTPYSYGGGGPEGPTFGINQGANTKGFDCSGLLQFEWAKRGVSIPRTTYDQFQTGQSIPRSQLQPGDAVFFKGSDSKNGLPGHVGIFIGNGRFIEAPYTGSVVKISKLAGRSDYVGGRRYA